MNLFDYLLPFLLALGLLILFHELGHYLVARWCGVKVLRFSIGFGHPLYKRTAGRDRTEWVIAAFPLGGYVKMLDEREAPVEPHERYRAFNRQPVGRRFAIVAAGPLANFLLAIVVYWGLFVSGNQELSTRIMLTDGPSVARNAGLLDGDRIIAVEGETQRGWDGLRWAILRHALDDGQFTIKVQREERPEFELQLDTRGLGLDEGNADPMSRIGLRPYRPPIPPVAGRIMPGSAAADSGMQVGDRIVMIDDTPIDDWSAMVAKVRRAPDQKLLFTIERAGQMLTLEIVPHAEDERGERVGRIGVGVADGVQTRDSMFVEIRYGVFEGLYKAVRQTWETSTLTLTMMGKMLLGEVSWKNLSGPVTIADYAGQSAQLGLGHYLKFLALISISLGVLNLLPIPVLDGGHLLYYTVEMIKGGPIPERVMEIGQQIGFVLLTMLMAFALYNDLNRLLAG